MSCTQTLYFAKELVELHRKEEKHQKIVWATGRIKVGSSNLLTDFVHRFFEFGKFEFGVR
jgi:hypothetical protein